MSPRLPPVLALERTLFTLAVVALVVAVALVLDVVDRRADPALGAD